MKQLWSDVYGFMKNLTQADFLLYISILILIILVVSLIYIIKTNDEEVEIAPSPKKEEIDLKEVVNNIESKSPEIADFTSYEKDQEQKAIISYDELVARNKTENIDFTEEEIANDEISIKKIDIDHISPDSSEPKEMTKLPLLKYANEEAFLKTLKTLNDLLN